MSAVDHLNEQQFMGIEELKTVRAGDFPGETVGSMKDAWTEEAEHPTHAGYHRHAYKENGGAQGYLDSLALSMRENGVQEPLEVRHYTAEDGTKHPPMLTDGHHRALAALQSGLDRVPVNHINPPQGKWFLPGTRTPPWRSP